MTRMQRRCRAPVNACNDADQVGEVVDVVGQVPRYKNVVGQVIDVVRHPVARIEECVHMPPRALDRVRL